MDVCASTDAADVGVVVIATIDVVGGVQNVVMILNEKLDNDIAKLDLQRLQRPRRVLNYYLVFSKIVMVATSTKTLTEINSICFSSRLHKLICLDL